MRSLCVAILSCAFVSCSVDLPSYVISEGKMEQVLHDYHLAQGMAEAQGDDPEKMRYMLVQKVFEKYGITEEQFDTSMVWYSGHASHLDKIYKNIEARYERESREAGLNVSESDKYVRYTAEGDTANIWPGNDFFYVKGSRGENIYSLVIPADSTFKKGDTFMFRCSNRVVVQDMQRDGSVLMQLCYANASVVAATGMVNSDYDLSVTISEGQIRPDWEIKSLRCTFFYSFDESLDEAFRLWILSHPVLLRYHDLSPKDALTEASDSLYADSLSHRSDSVPAHPTDTTPARVRGRLAKSKNRIVK